MKRNTGMLLTFNPWVTTNSVDFTDPSTRPFRRLLPLEPISHTKNMGKPTARGGMPKLGGIGVYESEMHASLEAPIRLIREMKALKREKKKQPPKKLKPLVAAATTTEDIAKA